MNTQDAANSAMLFERKGYDYYMDVASRASNPLTKKVFDKLAVDELWHMERIKKLLELIHTDEAIDPKVSVNVEDVVKDFFENFTSQERTAWTLDNAEAYEYAMELENQGIAMYKKLAGEAESLSEALFFSSLQEEEANHLAALVNVFNYLEQSEDWFANEESQVWNWMNM